MNYGPKLFMKLKPSKHWRKNSCRKILKIKTMKHKNLQSYNKSINDKLDSAKADNKKQTEKIDELKTSLRNANESCVCLPQLQSKLDETGFGFAFEES